MSVPLQSWRNKSFSNNAINTDVQKRRFALLLHAGYGELMLTAEELGRAGSYVEQLRLSVHELDVPSTNRARAAGSCLAIAQEHHHAIIRLIEERLFASSFALLRIEFEAYIRGEWLSQCASDLIVEAFLRGKEPPKIDCLLADLEMVESFKATLNKSRHERGAQTHHGNGAN